MTEQKKRALLIGCDAYQEGSLSALKRPANDVRALERVLRAEGIGQFSECKPLINRSADELRKTVEDFLGDATSDETLLFYYSGHGLKNDVGQLFFSTPETKANRLLGTTLPAQFVAECLKSCRSKRIVLVLDCCFSGAFARTLGGKGEVQLDLGSRFDGCGGVVLAASSGDQVAYEEAEGDNTEQLSLFTRCLVHGLSSGRADLDGDGLVSVEELYEYLFHEVTSVRKSQTPVKWVCKSQSGAIFLARSPRGCVGNRSSNSISYRVVFDVALGTDVREPLQLGLALATDDPTVSILEDTAGASITFSGTLAGYERLLSLSKSGGLAIAMGGLACTVELVQETTCPAPSVAPVPDLRKLQRSTDRRGGVVCRLHHIEGWERQSEAARVVLPPPTNVIEDCVVFLTRGANYGLYAHSNFVSRGYVHTTKLATFDEPSILVVLANIISDFAGLSNDQEQSLIRRIKLAHHNSVTYIVDNGALHHGVAHSFNLEGASRVVLLKALEPISGVTDRKKFGFFSRIRDFFGSTR